MVSGDQAPEEKYPTSAAAAAATINPVLLALACCGNSGGLGYFLHGDEGAQQYRMDSQGQELIANAVMISGDGSLPSDDVEEGAAVSALSASSVLEGVTAEGDTALHAVACSGDGDNFLRSAEVIWKAKNLLFSQNNNGDTPLHCAARAGNSRMALHLIALARGEDGSDSNRVKAMLEMENKLMETALHDAVRIGNNDLVKMLMEEDSELACFPKGGTSALYIAVLTENTTIVETLYQTSHGNLSYSGPNGQNALHAAALRGPVLTGMLLEWKKGLSTQKDENGSTPLHFAAALLDDTNQVPQDNLSLHSEEANPAKRKGQTPLCFSVSLLRRSRQRSVCWQLLNANPAELYQPDCHGMYPIHVAASMGATGNVIMFAKKYPSSAGLRDSNGRTFLHIAVQKKKRGLVDFASKNHSLRWVLNMRDNGGDTALHLAVQAGSLTIFCALFGNRHVDMNVTNKKGQTPLDISRFMIPPEMFYNQNSEAHIRRALTMVGARSGASRQDHFEESYNKLHRASKDRGSDTENVKDTTQNLCIGSVLIATVTFGATFALPGGYVSDDHANGGTPTLAGRGVHG
ncbi:hypothetical protein CFC21_090351 [Triticum aestivum]|uniref:PGG domain-containing protein n=2 Tax=Triticum aestivum TaxID=4565 RepID=A0A9R1MRX0_WHEAT|nr:hypothetical protein CFC21_090351 [Triticum aestivum]